MPNIIKSEARKEGGKGGGRGQQGNGVETGNQETPVATRNHQEARDQERGRPKDVGS